MNDRYYMEYWKHAHCRNNVFIGEVEKFCRVALQERAQLAVEEIGEV